MTKGNRLILSLVAFVGIIVIAMLAYNSISKKAPDNLPSTPSQSQSEKTPFPDFTIENLEGKQVKLSDFNGKPVIINFWATWCGFCVEEMPLFQSYYEEYGDKIEFMMINATDGNKETEDKVTSFISEEGYTFPVYLDKNIKLISELGISSFPTTVIIDKDGFIADVKLGMYNEKQLKETIEKHLGE